MEGAGSMSEPLISAFARVLCWLFSPFAALVGVALLAMAYGLVYVAISGRIPK